MKNNLFVNSNPKSQFSESIKSIRTNISFTSIDNEVKTILVTSAKPGEGKSFISSNLAVAYAQEGKNVLIVDCDLRRGTQNKVFDLNKNLKGLSYLILNFKSNTPIGRYVVSTSIEGVSVLPAGVFPPNPSELLNSNNASIIFNKLREKYDVIIFDCPPVIGVNDSIILTKYSDANIIVTTCNKTKIDELNDVKKAFALANASITGVVLNKVPKSKNKYYSYYGTYY